MSTYIGCTFNRGKCYLARQKFLSVYAERNQCYGQKSTFPQNTLSEQQIKKSEKFSRSSKVFPFSLSLPHS